MNHPKIHIDYPGDDQPWTDHKGRPYFPTRELIQAVNASLLLGRPLLVMGEPGCGKTSLAGAVLNELNRMAKSATPPQAPWKSREWHVKSSQRARDGLYTYDLVGRLRDSQLLANNAIRDEERREELMARTPKDYIKLNALGKAFEADSPTVLLVDEIDKADRDFPNDLLLELDEKRFRIEELSEEEDQDVFVEAKSQLMTIITSNNERELPEPFLRRCVFFYIEFPKREILDRIVRVHLKGAKDQVIKDVLDRFEALRTKMALARGNGENVKPVSTSELIDWAKVLRQYSDDEIIEKLKGQIPYSEVLVKRWDDHLRFIAKHS